MILFPIFISRNKMEEVIKMTESRWLNEKTVKVTFFFTLNLTKNYNCKRYDEHEYDRKRTVKSQKK